MSIPLTEDLEVEGRTLNYIIPDSSMSKNNIETTTRAEQLDRISNILCRLNLQGENSLSSLEVMILVLEDRRYFSHPGFDILSILRAFLVTIVRGAGGGASTIEQQLVRTITGQREKTIKRKINEIKLSKELKKNYSKLEILRAYQILAYFGEGAKGAQSAAIKLFGRSVQQLSLYESAILASCLVYPIPSKQNAIWLTRIRKRAEYALLLYTTLTKGSKVGNYRVGIQKNRPYLLSEVLAQFIEEQRYVS